MLRENIFHCGEELLKSEEMHKVARILKIGGVIVYPTETLYGLGGSPKDKDVVERIFSIKRKPALEGVSIAFLSSEHVEEWVRLPTQARNLLDKYTPGPLTVLVPFDVLEELFLPTAPLFGIRIPSHPVARQIIEAAGPIISTSANRHGYPPDEKEALLVGEMCDAVVLADGVVGDGSTVVSVEEGDIKIIRPGPINPQQ